jgi:hypothetical protein
MTVDRVLRVGNKSGDGIYRADMEGGKILVIDSQRGYNLYTKSGN